MAQIDANGRGPAGGKAEERYTIRRKVLRVFGAGFEIFDQNGQPFGYCDQKGLRLREDIRVYTDSTKSVEQFRLSARTIMDFSTTYDVHLATGEAIGSLRRKGLKSTFVRDEWLVFDPQNNETALIQEKNAWTAFLRRMHELIALFSPQTFQVTRTRDGATAAEFRQHFNPFVYRLGVTIHDEADVDVDELVILAAACLLAAIEGRQG